jgi:hypothetical protein
MRGGGFLWVHLSRNSQSVSTADILPVLRSREMASWRNAPMLPAEAPDQLEQRQLSPAADKPSQTSLAAVPTPEVAQPYIHSTRGERIVRSLAARPANQPGRIPKNSIVGGEFMDILK